jgi:CBS domain-containing protein
MPDTPHIVSDVMTLPAVAVRRDTRFKDIVRAMTDRHVSAVPVVEGDGRVVGVVSEADLLPKEEFRDRDLTRAEQLRRRSDLAKAEAVTAQEVMSAPAIVVHPDVTLGQAARIMAVKRVKRLPVIDDEGRLVGVVSRGDLLKVFLRSDEDIEEEVRRTVVAYLFPALSHTIHVSVHDGVVTLRGKVRDPALGWVAERLVRAVEGVVDVHSRLGGEGPGPDPSGNG